MDKNRKKRQKAKWKKKQKARFRPQPVVTINRVKRLIEPKVPDDINLELLSDLYRIEGMALGISMMTMLPAKLIDGVSIGKIPTMVETIPFLKMIKEGLQGGHREAIDKLESLEIDIESLVGYTPLDEEKLATSDRFVRIITIPEDQGSGFCVELDPGCRGVGTTPGSAMAALAEMIDEYLDDPDTFLERNKP